jgi:Flp pilus assembly protein protease CpaA
MFSEIRFLIALVGSAIGGAYDLKTTEIPDIIPHAMIVLALFLAIVESLIQRSYLPIFYSLATGLPFLALGFLLYYFGQWGGGDAKLLAAVVFLLPTKPTFLNFNFLLPFPVTYLLNVLYVGAAYMILYALVLAFMEKKILREFFKKVKASATFFSLAALACFIAFLSINWYIANLLDLEKDFFVLLRNSLLPLVLFVSLILLWKFVKVVEDVGFKKRISVSKLKVGDVLLESKRWDGITEAELRKIKKSGKKFVTIKTGVRFGPVFSLALLFTFFYGDITFFLTRYLV